MILLGLCCISVPCDAMPAREGVNLLRTSLTYSVADVFQGLPASLQTRVDAVMDNRLADSSMRSVNSAYAHWKPVADEFGWDYIIPSDDPERGGKLAAFVLHLMDDTSLVYASIQNYVWGLRQYMMLQRQTDPCMNVRHWSEFMQGVAVYTVVPVEPRRAIPRDVIRAMLLECLRHRDDFWYVNFGFFVLILYFTFSRSECPCPKHFTGSESWDLSKHWAVRDIVIKCVAGKNVLAVRFKAVKQDPRVERPAARGDGSDRRAALEGGSDWAFVGNVDEEPWSVFMWYRLFMSFFEGPRDPTDPFFLARDRRRPYTYTSGMSDLKALLAVVGDDLDFGLHGFRVQGYNDSKSGNGEEITVVHGLWKMGSNNRYDRFNLLDVFAIPAGMVGATNAYAAPEAAEGVAQRDVVRRPVQRGETRVIETHPPPPERSPPPVGRWRVPGAARVGTAPLLFL